MFVARSGYSNFVMTQNYPTQLGKGMQVMAVF